MAENDITHEAECVTSTGNHASFSNDRAAWDAAMKRALEGKAKFEAFQRSGYMDHIKSSIADRTHKVPMAMQEQAEVLSSIWGEAEDELMEMPAPDRAALRWKLDQVLNVNDGRFTGSCSSDYVRQTVADYRRLLGDA